MQGLCGFRGAAGISCLRKHVVECGFFDSCFTLYHCVLAADTEHSNCTDGDVRLVGGTTEGEGMIEACHNNVWGTLCYDYSLVNDTAEVAKNIVCRQLGFQPPLNDTGI